MLTKRRGAHPFPTILDGGISSGGSDRTALGEAKLEGVTNLGVDLVPVIRSISLVFA